MLRYIYGERKLAGLFSIVYQMLKTKKYIFFMFHFEMTNSHYYVAVPLAPHCFTQCSPGAFMTFSSCPSVPLLITNRRNFILFMTAMKYQWITSSSEKFCLDPADSTQIAFPTVLMFFLVTQVRSCEDESRILNDLH
ncbi:hypothetical protein T09_13970 [Trichinella sp. T9]|nr:hypothetical protein T09_12598 [Trichinella sp. T9]KRX65019.1 hypothetical protein T09_13970 [Trichinella sp. T9]